MSRIVYQLKAMFRILSCIVTRIDCKCVTICAYLFFVGTEQSKGRITKKKKKKNA